MIDKYHARFIKFDFNQDVAWDDHQEAFLSYFRGYDRFLQMLKAKYPDLHMECCASGGLRMPQKQCAFLQTNNLTFITNRFHLHLHNHNSIGTKSPQEIMAKGRQRKKLSAIFFQNLSFLEKIETIRKKSSFHPQKKSILPDIYIIEDKKVLHFPSEP